MDYIPSSNINGADLDEETNEKLKGDSIGDTLYSESFVLKTLLKLSEADLNEELEQDLCFLWDMSIEKDVCEYLFNVNYSAIACTVINQSSNDRLIEIVIGIYGNLLLSECAKDINEIKCQIVFQTLKSEDVPQLIQTMRFIENVAFAFPDKVKLLDHDLTRCIEVILSLSQNEELIKRSLYAVDKLLITNKLYIDVSLYEAVTTGFDTLLNVQSNCFEALLDAEENMKLIKLYLQIVLSICENVEHNPHSGNITNVMNNCTKLSTIIFCVLQFFSKEENLLPVDDVHVYISICHSIFNTTGITFFKEDGAISKILDPLCNIFFHLQQSRNSDLLETYQLVADIIIFLSYSLDSAVISFELNKMPSQIKTSLLNYLKANVKLHDYEISDKFKFLCDNCK